MTRRRLAHLVAGGPRRRAPPARRPARRRTPSTPTLRVPQHTDVLGELLAVDDDGVLVRTRRGDVRVPAADIVLTKLVPPAPVDRRHRPTGA